MVDQHGHVFATACQLKDLKPDDEVVLRVDLVGSGAGVSPIFAAPDRLADRDGWGQETSWWSSCTVPACLCNITSTWSWLPVLLVVAVHLEYHRLGLHVLYEGPRDSDGDVLNVVEVQRGALPAIFQRFSRECLVMTVNKTIKSTFIIKILKIIFSHLN